MKITERQWKLINDIALRIHGIDDVVEMRRTFLSVFRALIHFDAASFYIQEGENPYGSPMGVNLSDEDLQRYISHYSHLDPFAPVIEMMGDTQGVMRMSDYIPVKEIDDSEYYKNVMAAKRIRYSLLMPLALNGEWLGCISLFRQDDSSDFTEAEVEMADVLRKHLQTRLHRENYNACNCEDIKDSKVFTKIDKELSDKYGLTERECEVIELTAQGLDDTEICEAMAISKNTLKKHISHIYSKMSVNSRISLLKAVHSKGNPIK